MVIIRLTKILALTIFTFLPFIYFIGSAQAHCPLCTAATITLVAATRYYGVDDAIVGTFIGGAIVSSAFWLDRVLKKRHKQKEFIPYQLCILVLFSVVSTVVSFYFAGMLGTTVEKYKMFGVDKIFLGMMVGSIVTAISPNINQLLKNLNGHKNRIRFQLMILTLMLLSLSGLTLYSIGYFW